MLNMKFPVTTPIPNPATGCTCARLRRLTRRITALYDRELAATGLRLTQYSLLSNLRRSGGKTGLTLSELAVAMDMDRTTLSRNLHPLQKQQLVTVGLDKTDGRVRRVAITHKGSKAFDAAEPLWAVAQASVTATLGEQNVHALHGWIDGVLPAFRDDLQGEKHDAT